jgi:NADPH:quinone reductase-like Zn-dependent oxidoreductase
MKAAVIQVVGGRPAIQEFPTPLEGHRMKVLAAGSNPADVKLLSGTILPISVPRIVGREGIALAEDGGRMYFLDPPEPFGSWAEYVPATARFLFPVEDHLPDDVALAMATSGTAGWLAVRKADIQPGDRILILGATGAVGQIALQSAKLHNAGHIVAAGRDAETLARMTALGADAIVDISGDNYAEALQHAAGSGFNVVIDAVSGGHLEAAIRLAATGARIVTTGRIDAPPISLQAFALMGKTLIGHSNSLESAATLQQAMFELGALHRQGRMGAEIRHFPLDEAPRVWDNIMAGIHYKAVIEP